MESLTVEALMADLDIHIAGELAVMQARGADRQTIEVRHKELCNWALDQCAKAEGTHARPAIQVIEDEAIALSSPSDELTTLRYLWERMWPSVHQALRAGMTVDWIELVRCEDGMTVFSSVEIAEDPDITIYASCTFYSHFNPSNWERVLASIAVDYDCPLYVDDLFPEAAWEASQPPGAWRRVS